MAARVWGRGTVARAGGTVPPMARARTSFRRDPPRGPYTPRGPQDPTHAATQLRTPHPPVPPGRAGARRAAAGGRAARLPRHAHAARRRVARARLAAPDSRGGADPRLRRGALGRRDPLRRQEPLGL